MAHVVERLASWAVQFRREAVAPEVRHHAKRAVIDLHAAMNSGAKLAPAALLEKALADELDRGAARLALGRAATMRRNR
jgi:2-methylcitrate dehydratase PrpD